MSGMIGMMTAMAEGKIKRKNFLRVSSGLAVTRLAIMKKAARKRHIT